MQIKNNHINYIERMGKIAFLSTDDKIFLTKLFELKSYKRGTIIDQQGGVSQSVYYLKKGIFSMEYNKNQNIFIRDFIFKNSPALVYPSFFLNKSSRYSIRAITDCVVWELSKENFEIGKKKIPSLRIIAFKITNLFHQNIEKRFESLITKTAEENYVDLVKSHNEIINLINLKDIASYLGITSVTLSRIRSRIAKRGYIS